jgi:ABC-2 type transport system permease protein
MLTDVLTVMWKEARELLRIGGSRRKAVLRLVFSVGVIGVLWPWQIGAQFVTSGLAIVLAAFVASMHVAAVVPDSFAGERERHTLETLLASRLPDQAILVGKLSALIAYGLLTSFIMLAFGLVTVNVIHGHGRLLLFAWSALSAAAIFSILAAALTGVVGVLVSLKSATVKHAQQILSTGVMLLLFVPIIAIATVPPEWREAGTKMLQRHGPAGVAAWFALGLFALTVFLYAVIAARFKRSRLILEH